MSLSYIFLIQLLEGWVPDLGGLGGASHCGTR